MGAWPDNSRSGRCFTLQRRGRGQTIEMGAWPDNSRRGRCFTLQRRGRGQTASAAAVIFAGHIHFLLVVDFHVGNERWIHDAA